MKKVLTADSPNRTSQLAALCGGEEAMPRAFYIDVFTDDDTNTTEHAYYGAALPGRGAIARGCTDRGIYSLAAPERFADRVGGILRWA